MVTTQEILDFWYSKPISDHWFQSTPEIDQEITKRYEALWGRAAWGELDSWRATAEGCLALCIILDQFPLNMYRGDAQAFATEQQAVAITKYAIEQGFVEQLDQEKVAFLLMPLMHSEHMSDQDLAVEWFAKLELEGNLRFAQHHRDIVHRFGRFPHRNEALGRISSPEEQDYLNSKEAFTG